mmetsp:Transcript_30750/g.5552  ORF Transcript_30750/g.5552 Transcript_30750/m.5552 type:complete len:108 (+) Transcript_30750:1067-1390(+)
MLISNRHCNIITFMGVSLCDDKLQLITEFFSNKSLFEMIFQKGITLKTKQRFEIAIDIISALVFLHSNNPPIIHRDIKLENVFINDKMQAKLGDFGLSRLMLIQNEN